MNNDKSYEISKYLMLIPKLMNRKISQRINCKEINISSLMILRKVSEDNKKTLTEIAESLGLPNSTTSVLVDKLVKEGVLSRRQDDKDRRKVVIHMTEKGKEKVENIQKVYMQHFQDILITASDKEADTIIEGLKILAKVIEDGE